MKIRKIKRRIYRQFREELRWREIIRRIALRVARQCIEAKSRCLVIALKNALDAQLLEVIKACADLEPPISSGAAFAVRNGIGNGLSIFGSYVGTTGDKA